MIGNADCELTDTGRETTLTSEGSGFEIIAGISGHSDSLLFNQSGPFHHSWHSISSDGKRPHDAGSAGFSSLRT